VREARAHGTNEMKGDSMKVYQVKFRGERLSSQGGMTIYVFKSHLELANGDYVVVDGAGGMALARVLGETTKPNLVNLATAWIISKVDDSVYQARQEVKKAKDSLKAKMTLAFDGTQPIENQEDFDRFFDEDAWEDWPS